MGRFHPDVPPNAGLQYTKVQTCNCVLAKVWLFRVGRKWNDRDCLDYFMILKEIDIGQKKYGRFGMAIYGGHNIDERTKLFNEV
jgi:hypothetical protein